MDISPFQVHIEPAVLTDLHRRLQETRWPGYVTPSGWKYGVASDWLHNLVDYWTDEFDWEAIQNRLNEWPQFIAKTGEFNIHFLHVRSPQPDAVPLLLTIGWPSTFAEVIPILNALTNPTASDRRSGPAFDIVVPTIPGFGFSTPLPSDGWIPTDDLWVELMTSLGYDKFIAAGSDWGANITNQLARRHASRLLGVHFTSPDLELPRPIPDSVAAAADDYFARLEQWVAAEGAYHAIQKTKPQTLAFALSDSPVGLAAWLLEKFHAWSSSATSFNKDALLTTATIYWATNTAASSSRIYYEFGHSDEVHLGEGERVELQTGVLTFPKGAEPNLPKSVVEHSYNITRWVDADTGGHFPAFETPALFASELREFARSLTAQQ